MAQHLGRRIVIVLALLARRRGEPGLPGRLLFGAVLILAATATACPALPPQVDEITIVNRTVYDIDVQVSDPGRAGWLPIVRAVARSERVTQGVIDQGRVWIFRFSHQGHVVGELTLERIVLEESGWRLEIPDEIEERLRRRGEEPSP